MSKPCPLYLKPSDVLAAFSGEFDQHTGPRLLTRRPQRFALARVRQLLSNPGDRRSRLSAAAGLTARPQPAPGRGSPDERVIAAGAEPQATRGLLSHFTIMQTGA